MKNYVDELLNTMNTSLAYDDQSLHHRIMALSCDAVNGCNKLAYDTLAMIVFRYEGRVPETTLKAMADILELETCETKAVQRELLKRSDSLISTLNQMTLGYEGAESAYAAAAAKLREKLPARKSHPIRKKLAEMEGESCYRLMNNAQLVDALRRKMNGIGQGVPGSLPAELISRLGVTTKTAYALSYPYLLYDDSRLVRLYEETLTLQ